MAVPGERAGIDARVEGGRHGFAPDGATGGVGEGKVGCAHETHTAGDEQHHTGTHQPVQIQAGTGHHRPADVVAIGDPPDGECGEHGTVEDNGDRPVGSRGNAEAEYHRRREDGPRHGTEAAAEDHGADSAEHATGDGQRHQITQVSHRRCGGDQLLPAGDQRLERGPGGVRAWQEAHQGAVGQGQRSTDDGVGDQRRRCGDGKRPAERLGDVSEDNPQHHCGDPDDEVPHATER